MVNDLTNIIQQHVLDIFNLQGNNFCYFETMTRTNDWIWFSFFERVDANCAENRERFITEWALTTKRNMMQYIWKMRN